MFKATVTFRAKIKGNGVTFPSCEFNPNEPGVDKVEVECPTGHEIQNTVHLGSVSTPEEGEAIATRVNLASFDRIVFFHRIAIENARTVDSHFSPLNSVPGVLTPAAGELVSIGEAVTVAMGISCALLKTELEQASAPGEQYYCLFRSARQSMSPVEEFMHLYNILLMLFGDKQARVDKFIRREEPGVQETPDPRRDVQSMETVYTRLRNEFAHTRPDVNLNNTKADMANRLGGLIALTARAIELHPS